MDLEVPLVSLSFNRHSFTLSQRPSFKFTDVNDRQHSNPRNAPREHDSQHRRSNALQSTFPPIGCLCPIASSRDVARCLNNTGIPYSICLDFLVLGLLWILVLLLEISLFWRENGADGQGRFVNWVRRNDCSSRLSRGQQLQVVSKHDQPLSGLVTLQRLVGSLGPLIETTVWMSLVGV